MSSAAAQTCGRQQQDGSDLFGYELFHLLKKVKMGITSLIKRMWCGRWIGLNKFMCESLMSAHKPEKFASRQIKFE